jgi:hypothetical protein
MEGLEIFCNFNALKKLDKLAESLPIEVRKTVYQQALDFYLEGINYGKAIGAGGLTVYEYSKQYKLELEKRISS